MSRYKHNSALRALLENPDLLKVKESSSKDQRTLSSNKMIDMEDIKEFITPHPAFLGPNIWERTIPSTLLDINSEVIDALGLTNLLDELADMPSCDAIEHIFETEFPLSSSELSTALLNHTSVSNEDKSKMIGDRSDCQRKNSSRFIFSSETNESSNNSTDSKDDLTSIDISGEESFDPKKTSFSDAELKVLPMLKKCRKKFIPDDLKDEKYWARRNKNNTSAKRSREARRIKENQITLRTAFLEKENQRLEAQVDSLLSENDYLRKKLEKYETVSK